nr:MAG TPA: hypothetical protein [Caudoviricetes sp.]
MSHPFSAGTLVGFLHHGRSTFHARLPQDATLPGLCQNYRYPMMQCSRSSKPR